MTMINYTDYFTLSLWNNITHCTLSDVPERRPRRRAANRRGGALFVSRLAATIHTYSTSAANINSRNVGVKVAIAVGVKACCCLSSNSNKSWCWNTSTGNSTTSSSSTARLRVEIILVAVVVGGGQIPVITWLEYPPRQLQRHRVQNGGEGDEKEGLGNVQPTDFS